MGLDADLPEGATPIDPDEAEGLLLSISTQAELNEFEALGILGARAWADGNRRFLRTFPTEPALRTLHRRMFGTVWRWAGAYRRTQMSVGVEAFRIPTEVRGLVDDTEFWISAGTYSAPEIAARFHHRLVRIHPFPNGNGRHARLATDLLCEREGWPRSPWGQGEIGPPGDVRTRYIAALRAADAHDVGPLLAFMK